jgi:hypothetical protein
MESLASFAMATSPPEGVQYANLSNRRPSSAATSDIPSHTPSLSGSSSTSPLDTSPCVGVTGLAKRSMAAAPRAVTMAPVLPSTPAPAGTQPTCTPSFFHPAPATTQPSRTRTFPQAALCLLSPVLEDLGAPNAATPRSQQSHASLRLSREPLRPSTVRRSSVPLTTTHATTKRVVGQRNASAPVEQGISTPSGSAKESLFLLSSPDGNYLASGVDKGPSNIIERLAGVPSLFDKTVGIGSRYLSPALPPSSPTFRQPSDTVRPLGGINALPAASQALGSIPASHTAVVAALTTRAFRPVHSLLNPRTLSPAPPRPPTLRPPLTSR